MSGETYTTARWNPWSSSLPSERVKPSRARWAIRSPGVVTSSWVVPMTAKRVSAGGGRAHRRLEELEQLTQLVGRGDAGGIEHQRAVLVGRAFEVAFWISVYRRR